MKPHGPALQSTIFVGDTNHIHTTRRPPLSDDLPLVTIIVNDEERIRRFLPALKEPITEGLVMVDPVQAIRYAGNHTETAR